MSLEHLIEQSTDRYQAMLDHLTKMAEVLKDAQPQTIRCALEDWQLLQQEAQQLDARIDQLTGNIQRNELPTKYQQRSELMAQVAQQCQQVYSHANLLKALVSDELSRLQHGRRAMGGYKVPADKKGFRLTASF
jgi:hypothetical protein